MTHRAAKLAAVYLLLGLVATVLSALLPQFFGASSPMFSGPAPSVAGSTPWPVVVPAHWPPKAEHQATRRWLGHDLRFTWLMRDGDLISIGSPGPQAVRRRGDDLFHVWEQRYGWPWRAARQVDCHEQWVRNGAYVVDNPSPEGLEGGLLIPGLGSLTAYPIWPGLLADTLFYAMLFAGLHQLTAWGRRTRRRRRGCCAACGYDLTGITGVCPECGSLRPLDLDKAVGD